MIRETLWPLPSTTPPPVTNKRIRIGGRLKSVGDTVLILSRARNGTTVDICSETVWVLPQFISLEPTVETFSTIELDHGAGIGSLHRAWLNGLEIYYFDPILCTDL